MKELWRKAPTETEVALGLVVIGTILGISNIGIRLDTSFNVETYKLLGENLGNLLFWQGGDMAVSIFGAGAVGLGVMYLSRKDGVENIKKNGLVGLLFGSLGLAAGPLMEEVIIQKAKDASDLAVFAVPLISSGIFLARHTRKK